MNFGKGQKETVVLALGSNLGDRLKHLQNARASLSQRLFVSIESAPLYGSEPVGAADEPFFNTAVRLETDLSPEKLLGLCKDLERRLGRTPSARRWSNRIIDIDIICYGDHVITTKDLTIPHEEYSNRLFVLLPLAHLMPEWVDPVTGTPIDDLISSADQSQPTIIQQTW